MDRHHAHRARKRGALWEAVEIVSFIVVLLLIVIVIPLLIGGQP